MCVMDILDEKRLMVVHFNNKKMLDMFLLFPQLVVDVSNYMVIIGSLMKFGVLFAAEVRKQELIVDAEREEVQVLEYDETETVFDRDEILKRAHSKVGINDYNIFFNNCESFINWIMIGRRASNQGKNAAIGGLVLIGILVVIGAIVLAILL